MAQYNNAQVRKWLTGFFENEEDFDFFAEDNFSEVFEQFAAGDSLNKKGRLVAQYCEDKQEFEQLFTLVKNEDPDRFAEFPPPDPIEAAEPTAASRPPEPAVPPQAEPTTEPAQTTSPAPVEEMPAEPSAQNQVFISYSRRDLPFVTQLYQELTARNIPTWFDQSSIEVADHWRTSIVKGIKEADVFVLVLSPESLASVNVRKEVDLAERYKKTIIPLRWIKSDIPEAFDYQLAGLQYIRFDETTSVEKFDQLADVVRRLVGGSDLEKATAGKSVAEAPLVPAIPKEEPAADSGPKKLGGLKTKRKPRLNPVALGSSVISGVLTTVGADLEQEDRDRIGAEIKWLFSIADYTLKVEAGEIEMSDSLPYPNPPEAEVLPSAAYPRTAANYTSLAKAISQVSQQLKTDLEVLDRALLREADLGEAAINDRYLQTEIKGKRLSILQQLIKFADVTAFEYGIRVNGPKLLFDFVQEG